MAEQDPPSSEPKSQPPKRDHRKKPEALKSPPLTAKGKPDLRSVQRIDDEGVRGIVAGAIAAGATIETAAHIAKVSPAVIYDRKAKDEEFRVACDQARAKTTALLGMTAVKVALTNGHPQQATMLIFCLKNFDPVHWRDRRELEVAVGDISSTLREAADEARARRTLRLASAVDVEIVEEEGGEGGEDVTFKATPPDGSNGNGSNGNGSGGHEE